MDVETIFAEAVGDRVEQPHFVPGLDVNHRVASRHLILEGHHWLAHRELTPASPVRTVSLEQLVHLDTAGDHVPQGADGTLLLPLRQSRRAIDIGHLKGVDDDLVVAGLHVGVQDVDVVHRQHAADLGQQVALVPGAHHQLGAVGVLDKLQLDLGAIGCESGHEPQMTLHLG